MASSRVKSLQDLWDSSPLAGLNAAYVEQLYEEFLTDPDTVPEQWRAWFDALPQVNGQEVDVSHAGIRNQFREMALHPRPGKTGGQPVGAGLEYVHKQVRVLQLINAYRFRGHQKAKLDPLYLHESAHLPELSLAYHELSDADLETDFETGSLAIGSEKATLKDIVRVLNDTYCSSIGAEYMHLTNTEEKRWLQHYLESVMGKPAFSMEEKRKILTWLTAAEGLERYLHTRYVGQKRFSLEGGESLVPMLKTLIDRCGYRGVEEVAIGMAHRGRLNVLVNIMGKTPAELFREFEGGVPLNGNGTGDVKYHMGFSSDIQTSHGAVHVALAFNPSHLEIVGPVVEGSVRARQDRRHDKDGSKVVPVVLHGDAAFAGQGVVMETFNMSQSRGYSTKGTIHIILNNQIGFTTSHQEDARSTLYSSDVAKMVGAPILHVNGDDPESVVFVTKLAVDYRSRFAKDIVIDLVCYRRHGHSEADEPMATQPLMYREIRQHDSPREIYTRKLQMQNIIDETVSRTLIDNYRNALDTGNSVVEELIPHDDSKYSYVADWSEYVGREYVPDVYTAVSRERIVELADQLHSLPQDFVLHSNVEKIFNARRKMVVGEANVDWGFAETMAYATLLHDGSHVRLSGQDSGRGTFFHRHAVLHDQNSGEVYIPLRNLAGRRGNFLVINSLLSEEAVLAFEYGYATTDPHTLTIWEAQFGDFANNAQVVIDQFISSGEQKWNRMCGLVMLLPHGMEGQGPEHSSARLERYLQLCGQHNMQVCVPTNAAQIFHLLRRQMLMECRRPLIVMSPKSLLRHPGATCELDELINGEFKTVIGDQDGHAPEKITRLILCTGKVYYDLMEHIRSEQREDTVVLRIEQLYPFPVDALEQELQKYTNVTRYVWCQEEPKNQGAWFSSQHHMHGVIGKRGKLKYAGRPFYAATAVGSAKLHIQQQKELVEQALKK
ncbi:MAG: 2-oxoglutarate dehydrogenase E1 component [Gammaproteobacteria bacterium]|nr:2-oxoglutarate dehydrogenase E1 component [Gammaproteobacteria bacterium]MDH5651150.1 2-oxoglutarate dehydrogenase E1 component [Gammaproteobacteria bacterium]